MVQTFDMSRRDNGTNKSNNHSQGWDHHVETTEFDSIGHHVKKGKRGACRQKAATVLPHRSAAAKYIYSRKTSSSKYVRQQQYDQVVPSPPSVDTRLACFF